MRKFLHLFVSAVLILSLTVISGCSSTDTDETDVTTTASGDITDDSLSGVELDGFDGYVVVRGDVSDKIETDAAILLSKAIPDIELTTDWVKRGESIPEDAKEILVGETNRPESIKAREGLRYDDYTIEYVGNRIVIVGGSPDATYAAVERFISDQSEYTYSKAYRINDPTFNGVPVEKYVIHVPSSDKYGETAFAARLNTFFVENCGIELPVVIGSKDTAEYEIEIGLDEYPETNGYCYGFDDDGKTFIINGGSQLGFSYAAAEMMSEFNAADKIELAADYMNHGTAKYKTAEVYIDSVNGNDGNNGTESQPFASVAKAFEYIRGLTELQPYEVVVYLYEGTYPITEAIDLTADGLAANSSRFSFKNINNSSPVITALVPVSEFTETTVNGVTAWIADLPEGIEYTHQAFSDSQVRLSRPRFPKTGYLTVAGHPTNKDPFASQNGSVTEMTFRNDEIPRIGCIDDVLVRVHHYWTDEMLEVKSIDYENQIINFNNQSIFALRDCASATGANYFLDNVFEALSAPGEFYVDREAKKLYYIPFEGDKLGETKIYLSAPIELMNIVGASNISFEGITFEGTDWTLTARTAPQAATDVPFAINIADSDNISFNNCKFRHIGNSVMCIDTGSSFIDITHCDFTDIGAGAITIRGQNQVPSDPEIVIHDVNVSDCLIESYGRVYANAVGINLMYAYDCTISHNEIHDGYYTGISCGWVWGYADHATRNIAIEYNHIYDIGQGLLSDMGGIYTLGNQPGTVIRNNLIHDVQMLNYGGWGVYLDEGSTDILVENNICYNFTAEPFHQHYGKDNIIRNNILAFGQQGQFYITRREEHNSLTLENNILIADGTPIYAIKFDERNFTFKTNLIWDYSGAVIGEAHGICADPEFGSVENYDFTLSESSPALEMDFIPIDMTTVGIRPIY